MIDIKDLFLKYHQKMGSDLINRDIFAQKISEIVGFEIKKEDFVLKNNIIYLNVKSIYKSSIFLKKDIILKELKEVLGEKAPRDIK